MAITIKELHIKINVDEKPLTQGETKPSKVKTEAIIAACVEEVMNVLERQKER